MQQLTQEQNKVVGRLGTAPLQADPMAGLPAAPGPGA
jgi:hypothetical protein